MAKTRTTTKDSTEHTNLEHDSLNRSEPEDGAECRRHLITHEISCSRADTPQSATSSQSQCSSTTLTQLLYDSFDLSIAKAKHELMVTLMKEVYALFDTGWKVRTCANSKQESSGTRAQSSRPEDSRVGKSSKKRMRDRDSSPPGDGDGKREKKDDPDIRLHHQSRTFACPFHKHDPYKYSFNGDTGVVYRSCPTFGSASISHLR